ncbi:MAG: PqqD family protein [Candidatus Marinimicrobia bacterium]|nr:PqqD family protein [Candidatus Neomarinimicrobiota bacterium]
MGLLDIFKKKAGKKKINLEEVIPRPLVDSKVEENGNITLLKPKFKNRFLKKYILPRLKSKHFKIHLDKIGSAVWKHIDGQKTGVEIAKKVNQEIDEDLDPLYQRLAIFLSALENNNFIEYKKNEQRS